MNTDKLKNWTAPAIPDDIPHGDMPGDSVRISEKHISKAQKIFPHLIEEIMKLEQDNPDKKIVVSVCGGSGVGKSETASLLSFYLNDAGIGTYTMSGDNYPHRIPKYNDLERERVYAESGEDSLRAYLGSEMEINFKEVNEIIRLFHSGENTIYLRRMGRTETALSYEPVDFSGIDVLMLEWTHGNNDNLRGIDIPILLGSTPAETLAHRIERNRDGAPDSPFITMVLGFEQDMLTAQSRKAKIILSKQGDIISYDEYIRRVNASR
ncbi:MAG: adenylylsulfate kinase [Mogibacterium sp.]|nr:adenylylsulfate kinase [Mogibacterium sp.]